MGEGFTSCVGNILCIGQVFSLIFSLWKTANISNESRMVEGWGLMNELIIYKKSLSSCFLCSKNVIWRNHRQRIIQIFSSNTLSCQEPNLQGIIKGAEKPPSSDTPELIRYTHYLSPPPKPLCVYTILPRMFDNPTHCRSKKKKTRTII